MRLLNILVIGALILAASFVYKIKFDSTLQAEKVVRLRGDLRHEREAIATLRAEWARLDNPARLQALAQRYLPLKPIDPRAIRHSRPPARAAARHRACRHRRDPIADLVGPDSPMATGSVAAGEDAMSAAAAKQAGKPLAAHFALVALRR